MLTTLPMYCPACLTEYAVPKALIVWETGALRLVCKDIPRSNISKTPSRIPRPCIEYLHLDLDRFSKMMGADREEALRTLEGRGSPLVPKGPTPDGGESDDTSQ